jgi:PAS domain S-box-containing protein
MTAVKYAPAWRHSLGHRLILYITLFSSVVTLCSTGAQIYYEYRRDIGSIEANLGQIEKSYLNSITEGLWTFNKQILQVQLQGILDLPDMRYLEISKDGAPIMAAGSPSSGKSMVRTFPLRRKYRDTEMSLGTLRVEVGLDGVYQRMKQRVFVILLTQGIKTFLVSAFIFFLFYRLVGRHLKEMAAYARSLVPGKLDRALVIDRHGQEGAKDELGIVVDAINDMRLNLIEDMANRQQAEEKLRKSESLYHSLVETSQDLIWQCDAEGRYTYLNPAWEQVFGYELHEMLGKRFGDFQAPGGAGRDLAEFNRLMEGGSVTGFETTYVGKSGNEIHLVLNAVRVRDENGNTVGTSGTAYDITERKQAEEGREYLQKQLLHAQKLESLGVLAGGIAHDFNNILMAVIANADLALMRLDKESPVIENLRRIEQAAERAADLAKQMLAYSGKGRFVIEGVDLNRLVDEMVHMLEVSISKSAVLRLDLAPSLPAVEADATQIRQVVMNLVINASEAIGDRNGFITITTGAMACDRGYLKDVWLAENLTDGPYVYLEIADNGCGMDRETLSRLFDPFFTTKFTGRGLGMAAVLGIVRGHKGAITVASEPGSGTTFKVLLPVSGKPAGIPEADRPGDGWKGEGTVLLVDDEELVRSIGREMLQELGFGVVTASDGHEALEAFKDAPDIAFVILDLTMPHMDGERCFHEMKRLKRDVKVIISSGFSEHEVAQKFAGMGLEGFIQKPYKLSALRDAIRGMVSGSPA